MATQTVRCIYCDFTAKCLSKDAQGNIVKGLDALQEHIELRHPEVVKKSKLDDIHQMQKDFRESIVEVELEELCALCDYKEPSDGGWCYMFKDMPKYGCAKFKQIGDK